MDQDAPTGMVRASTQFTPHQYAWLRARTERLGLGSIAAAVRMIVQEAMNGEYRATTTDADTEQG